MDWAPACAGEQDSPPEKLAQPHDSRAILFIEPREAGSVDVEHRNHLHVADQRNDDLARRGAVAGDVTGKRMDVLDQLHLAGRRGGTAHPLA